MGAGKKAKRVDAWGQAARRRQGFRIPGMGQGYAWMQ
jgi:hypothetical protein